MPVCITNSVPFAFGRIVESQVGRSSLDGEPGGGDLIPTVCTFPEFEAEEPFGPS